LLVLCWITILSITAWILRDIESTNRANRSRRVLEIALPCFVVFGIGGCNPGPPPGLTTGSQLDLDQVIVMAMVEQVSPCLETRLGRYVLYRYPAEIPNLLQGTVVAHFTVNICRELNFQKNSKTFA